jgi:hypothetical protein|tara:strand:- start:39208 stop:39447 length:240 start_codon:yes stop_codon:yes gene_type:complete
VSNLSTGAKPTKSAPFLKPGNEFLLKANPYVPPIIKVSTKAGDDEFIKCGINDGFVGGIGYFITLFAYWVIDGFRKQGD